MTRQPKIPYDVIETIIGRVAILEDDSQSSLKSCTLVCKSFLELSRRHLFFKIFLFHYGDTPSLDRYLRFVSLLTSSPELALYIREITIFNSTISSLHGNIFNYPTLSDILGLLRNIRSLNLYFMDPGSISWESLEYSFQTLFANMLSFSLLEHVSLYGLKNIPRALIQYLARISSLSLCRTGFDSFDQHVLNKYRCNLKSLCISTLNLEEVQPFIDFMSETNSKLEKIEVLEDCQRNCDDIKIARRIMETRKQSLIRLDLSHTIDVN
ncbi:hypothetical protein BDQ17DRAFT_1546455, partial [Cyathus striatus]